MQILLCRFLRTFTKSFRNHPVNEKVKSDLTQNSAVCLDHFDHKATLHLKITLSIRDYDINIINDSSYSGDSSWKA